MKRCPRCGQGYTDVNINFCLNDGELLMQYTGDQPHSLFSDEPPPTQFADDSPPTVMMNQARETGQTRFTDAGGISPWQGQNAAAANRSHGVGMYATVARDQTMPTVSLVLGIISFAMVCCFGGIWLGIPAAIIGFLGMRNAENQPNRYGGRGIAVAGMVLGTITALISMVHLIFSLLAG